jgi:hypothetical protein
MINFIGSMILVTSAIFAVALVMLCVAMFVQKTEEMTKDDHSKN